VPFRLKNQRITAKRHRRFFKRSAAAPATKIDWNRVAGQTISGSITFGLMGLLFVFAWFPLLTGIYNDLGFQPNSDTLTVRTYLLLCVTVGFSRAVLKSRISSTYVPPPVLHVPATATVPPVDQRLLLLFLEWEGGLRGIDVPQHRQ
jgi:hypothetical protein